MIPRLTTWIPRKRGGCPDTRTKAILPVPSLWPFGRPGCDRGRRTRGAGIEDAAQAIGPCTRPVRSAVSGRVGCFSSFPAESGRVRRSGLVATNDSLLAIGAGCAHSWMEEVLPSRGGRELPHGCAAAAVLAGQGAHLTAWTEARRANAAKYVAPVPGGWHRRPSHACRSSRLDAVISTISSSSGRPGETV